MAFVFYPGLGPPLAHPSIYISDNDLTLKILTHNEYIRMRDDNIQGTTMEALKGQHLNAYFFYSKTILYETFTLRLVICMYFYMSL